MQPVDSTALREAVAKFATAPSEKPYVDVVRECLHGDLLLYATGSDIRMADDDTVAVTIGQGPSGEPAVRTT